MNDETVQQHVVTSQILQSSNWEIKTTKGTQRDKIEIYVCN